MRTLLLSAVTSTLFLIGCTSSGQVQYTARVTTPELVYINPEVQVIADYREPIFYQDRHYWRHRGGVWYRSPRHTSGWVRVETVPVAIRRIERPSAYIHYRAGVRAGARSRPAMREAQKNERRDHEDHRPGR